MEVSRRARAWAGAGLMAALGLPGAGRLLAQEGSALPPIGSVPEARSARSLPPRAARGAAPAEDPSQVNALPPAPATKAAPPAPAFTPPLPSGGTPAHPRPRVPDDGLGSVPSPPGDGCGKDGKEDGPKEWWQKVPQVRPLPPVGWYPIPPGGPGYYSILDAINDNYRKGPPKYPYPRVGPFYTSFFEMDWRYLDDPGNTEHDKYDFLKRQRCGPCGDFLFTTGGEFRARYNYEENSRLLNTGPVQLRGKDNTYDLYRLRTFVDIFYLDQVRLYAEFISATSPDFGLPPAPIDRNSADLLNLFLDFNLFKVDDSPVWFRLGRQELLYGSQRLISPLDWANTRRTFQGGKLWWDTGKDAFDLFCVQPVLIDPFKFDSVDNNQVFAGAWYTHRWSPTHNFDAYYLMLDNTNPTNVGLNGVKGGTTVHTFGSRYVGDSNNFLWDFECMLQCGGVSNQSLFAGAATAGLGYQFKELGTTPMFWVYYDHASGSDNPGTSGTNHTFNQLFPFGHYYFGYIDVVGRRNINDISTIATFWPAKWMFTQVQFHNFYLDSGKDALYNAAGQPIRQDPTGRSGNQVGQEIDFLVNFHLSNHSDLLLSYSYLWAGTFLLRTATTPSGRDNPQALYVQYSYRW